MADSADTEPAAAEVALGFAGPADMILDVANNGDHWGIVTIDGRTLRLPKDHDISHSRAADAGGGDSSPGLDPEDAPAGDRAAALAASIAGLTPGEEGHWTKSGKPEVWALEAATGLKDISAAERDAAWDAHRAAHGEA